MPNYIAFIYGKIKSSQGIPQQDGAIIAGQCIAELERLNKPGNFLDKLDYFPPKLLILLVTPAYLQKNNAKQLVNGIQAAFVERCGQKIPLIGSSTSAVFFDQEIHKEGILLICLASRFITAQVGIGKNVSVDHRGSVDALARTLNLIKGEDLNPKTNRLLLTFFSTTQSAAQLLNLHASDEVHKYLAQRTLHRIPIAGGGSAAVVKDDVNISFQFLDAPNFNSKDDLIMHRDSIVAALIETGVPLGGTFSRGLEKIPVEKLRINEISSDGKMLRFDDKMVSDLFNLESDYLLFSDGSEGRDLIIGVSEPGKERTVRKADKASKGDLLTAMKPQPRMMLKMAKEAIRHTKKRTRIEQPLACLVFSCSSHFHKRELINLDLEDALKSIEKDFGGPCVGGFLDGEAGIDVMGRSQFGNWSMVGLYFGDELRDRTPLYSGFEAISEYNTKLSETSTLEDVIQQSLDLIFKTGFPGAMISIVQTNYRERFLVGKKGLGPRLGEFCKGMSISLEEFDVLSIAAKGHGPFYLSDSTTHPNFDNKQARKTSLYSQYIIPLNNTKKETIGVLQIDLGDTRSKLKLHQIEKEVMNSIGATISSGINRFLDMEEVRIGHELDVALTESLSKGDVTSGLQHFIGKVVDIFRVQWGHIRIEKNSFEGFSKKRLELVAGVGEYFEVALKERLSIPIQGDDSPTIESYQTGEPVIMNDALRNEVHRNMCDRTRGRLKEIRRRVEGFVNTPVKNQRGRAIGTINLISKLPWFFSTTHEKALKTLGERTGILVRHLLQKQESEENLKRIKFLHAISPTLEGLENVKGRSSEILSNTIEDFAKAMNAQIASLFLWNENIEKYVLQAQVGWKEGDRWLGSAKYERNEGWTGYFALEENIIRIPDLVSYGDQLPEPRGTYQTQKFGQKLSPEHNYEAIALPLRAANQSVGIFFLYRKLDVGRESGFTAVTDDDLKTAADQLTSFINALLIYRENLRQNTVQEMLQDVHNKIFLTHHNHLNDLTEDICEKLGEISGASEVAFYNIIKNAAGHKSIVKFGSPISSGASSEHQDIIITSFLLASGSPTIQRFKCDPEDRFDPRKAAIEGNIARVTIPVIQENETTNIVDIKWSLPGLSPSNFFLFHREMNLLTLGRQIGSAYKRYKLTFEWEEALRQAEQSDSVIQAMAGMVAQSIHSFGSLLRALRGMPRALKGTLRPEPSESGILQEIEHLRELVLKGERMTERPLKVAREIIEPKPRLWRLHSLIEKSILRVCEINEGKTDHVQTRNLVPKDISVYVDRNCIDEAFFNIIQNAFKVIKESKKGSFLEIRATVNENRVNIVFEDDSIGMTPDAIIKAKRGFFHAKQLKGIGVLIALILIRSQRGSFDIESEVNVGTKVLVQLPLNLRGIR